MPNWATPMKNLTLYRELKRFIWRRVRNQADAEDIVQDVFIKAQLKGNQLKEDDKFSAWMYQITRNTIIDYYRKKKKVVEELMVQNEAEDYNQFNDCVIQCLQQLMHQLPSPYREALVMTEIEQRSQKEIAEKLNISYSGLKSRVQRGRQMLREKMEELYHIRTDSYGNVIECEDRVPCGCSSYSNVRELNRGPAIF
jgi:RNA polymerase sigma-70 factor (ECF subfamily)